MSVIQKRSTKYLIVTSLGDPGFTQRVMTGDREVISNVETRKYTN